MSVETGSHDAPKSNSVNGLAETAKAARTGTERRAVTDCTSRKLASNASRAFCLIEKCARLTL